MPVPVFLAVVSAKVVVRTRASAAASVILPSKPCGTARCTSRLCEGGGVR
jgi:hypothetical protein